MATLAWFSAAEQAAGDQPGSADRITPALESLIRGDSGLDDVRVDVFWSADGRATTARVFGDGVGIWQREKQFRLPKARILDILTSLRQARFGSMPDRIGDDEDEEKNEGPRLKGRLVVRAGALQKSTLQLVDGEQSEPFAHLVERILAICAGAAKNGVGASSMADALRLVASGRLSPEALEVTVQRRPDPKGPDQGWILRLNGLWVSDERIDTGSASTRHRELALSKKEFHDLAVLLSDAEPAAMPQSLYAANYTDVTIEVFKYSRTIAGRRFLGMTSETHGDRQKAFDGVVAALAALHQRVEKEGRDE